MPMLQLVMGLSPAFIFELGPKHEGFDTDRMTECCSVILLWDKNARTGLYQHGRGIHVMGGFECLESPDPNLARALFTNVPRGAGTLTLFVGPAFDDTLTFGTAWGVAEATEAAHAMIKKYLPGVMLRLVGMNWAEVGRDGKATSKLPQRTTTAWRDAKGKAKRPPPGCCTIL